MKKLLSTFLFFFIFFEVSFSSAQNFSTEEQFKIDSLNLILTNSNCHDTSLVEAYLLLSEILYISNMDTIIPLCERAKAIIEESLNKNPSELVKHSLLKKKATAFNNIGAAQYNKGEIEKSIENFIKSLEVSKKTENVFATADGLNNIGVIYYNQGEIEKALLYFHQSLKIREEIGNKKGIANSINSIGAIYKNQGELKLALQYFQKSLTVQREIGDKEGVAISLTNMGAIYREQGNNKKAMEYVQQSLKLYEELDNVEGIANCFMWFGVIHSNQAENLLISGANPEIVKEKKGKALDYNLKSLKLFEEIDNKHGISRNLSCIGLYYSSLGNDLLAKKYAKRSLELAQNLGFPKEVMGAASLLSKIYEKQNKGMQSLGMYKLFIQMRDSINNEATQKATAKQQAKYEYEKQKVLDDAENDKLIAIEKEEKEKQQVITYATGTGLGLVGVFLFFVITRLQVTRKQKKVIEEQKQEVEKQKEVVEEAHYLLEEKNKEIMDSITYAKRIQSAILPPLKVVKEYLNESFILLFYINQKTL
jgi:tetratricopeptide (TPR) repeat protein